MKSAPPPNLARPNLRMCERSPHPSLRWLLVVMVISCLCSYTAQTAAVICTEAVTYRSADKGDTVLGNTCVAVAGKTRNEKLPWQTEHIKAYNEQFENAKWSHDNSPNCIAHIPTSNLSRPPQRRCSHPPSAADRACNLAN